MRSVLQKCLRDPALCLNLHVFDNGIDRIFMVVLHVRRCSRRVMGVAAIERFSFHVSLGVNRITLCNGIIIDSEPIPDHLPSSQPPKPASSSRRS
jgi:hypothetical protein